MNEPREQGANKGTNQSYRERGARLMGNDEENGNRMKDGSAGQSPDMPGPEVEFSAAQVAQLEAMFGRRAWRKGTLRTRAQRLYLAGRERILQAMPPDEDQDFDESTFFGRARAFFARSWWARAGLGIGSVAIAGLWCGIILGFGR
jgi:hypothetical protein